ncbi:MAG: 4-oxalocrotonate tautomerase family protein [Reyranella sp.]|nr:4-oxalocrotonate tautomerase family protein [Reyranella sp.]
MPFVRTAVPQGTDASRKQLIVEAIHHALIQAIGMPEDELFNLVSEYNASDFL